MHVCTVPSAPWAAPRGWLSSQHPKFLHLHVSQPSREQVESLTQGEEQPSRTLCAGRASPRSPAEPFPLGDPVESRVRFFYYPHQGRFWVWPAPAAFKDGRKPIVQCFSGRLNCLISYMAVAALTPGTSTSRPAHVDARRAFRSAASAQSSSSSLPCLCTADLVPEVSFLCRYL